MKKNVVFTFSILALIFIASCNDKSAMREQLDYVSQCNRADTVFTEKWLPTVDSLVRFFDRHGNANERMMVHYLKGRVHHDMGEAPIALECYQKATEMADTTNKDCDLHTLAAIYGQMADLFHLQYLPDDEMKAIKMAEYYDWKNKDTLDAITAYRLRSRVYFQRRDTDSMLFVTMKSIDLYLQQGCDSIAAEMLVIPISVCLDRKQYKKAGDYLKTYEKILGYGVDYKFGKGLYNYYKGVYLCEQEKVDSAICYFRNTISRGFLEAGYKGLLFAYEKNGHPDSVAKYAKLFARANDSSFLGLERERIHHTTALYNFSRQQRIAERNEHKAETTQLYFVILLLAVATMAMIGRYYHNKMRSKAVRQIDQLLYAKAVLQAMLDEKEDQISVITEEKDGEIKRIRQEKSQLSASYLNEKKTLIEEITHLNQELRRFSNSNMELAFSMTSIGQLFQRKKNLYPKEKSPSALDWSNFTKSFREHFPHYFSSVTDGNRLSNDQLRICMMIRLNYHEYEMAFFMNVDKQRIDRVKTQVNKKLFGQENSSTLRKNLKTYF